MSKKEDERRTGKGARTRQKGGEEGVDNGEQGEGGEKECSELGQC